MSTAIDTAGDQIREWRQRRRLSQMGLALDAEISTRHLSFLETGRSRPSRDMCLRICERLEMPLRDRNRLLLAAGHAPEFPLRPLDAPDLSAARAAVETILQGHSPFPALAVDRHWNLVSANDALGPLLRDIDPELLQPPVNVLRLGLHPRGLAPRIRNIHDWRAHLLHRLRREAEQTGDPSLAALHEELAAYGPFPDRPVAAPPSADFVVPLELMTGDRCLRLISTTTVFGTARDVTLSELTIETFFPADEETRRAMLSAG